MDLLTFYDIFNFERSAAIMYKNGKNYLENVFSYPYLNDLNMYYCGKHIKTPNHSYGPEVREHFLIIYIKEGSGTLLSGKEKIKLLAGSIFVMFPNEKIHYICDKDSLWTISWVGVFGDLIYEFLAKVGLTPECPVLKVKNGKIIEGIFESIYNLSFSKQQSDMIKAISLLYDFFSCLISENEIKTDRNYLDEIMNIIQYNYDKNISITDLAKSVFMSPGYLSRAFKEEVGITLKEYILQKKIERAKELLLHKSTSVKIVSNSLGFKDSLYFSRIFKKKTGLSPLEFKKSALNAKSSD